MATAAVDEEEDVLTCSVCLDSYTDPCTLQCKHSFCRRCITDYVKTQADALQAKTIPCPSCRQVTRVPDPSRPVDEWAGQLQPGHVVREMIARVNKETTVEDIQCSPCQQLGETSPAKFWCADCQEAYCQGCARIHPVMSFSRGHDLFDMKEKAHSNRQKRKCKEHKDQLLQLYCKICNVSHCPLCFVDHHRKCEDVVTVKSFVSNMKTELSELKHHIEEKEKKSNNLIEHQKNTILKLNTDKVCIVEEIRCASQKSVDLIKENEKQMIEQVEEIKNEEINELKSKVKMGYIQVQTYRQYSEYIKQAVSSDSEVEVCDVYQVWKSGQLDISQEGDEEMGGGNIPTVRFDNEMVVYDFDDVWAFGQLGIIQEGMDKMGGGNISSVSFDNEIDVYDFDHVLTSGQLDISQERDDGIEGGNIRSVILSKQTQNIAKVLASLHFLNIEPTYLPTDLKSSPLLIESVYTREEHDEKVPFMRDVAVLEVGGVHTIVVTDYIKLCVKSFYTRNNKKCFSRLQLDNSPRGIARAGDDEVMIAVPHSNQVVTVAVTPDLVYETCINTSKSYYSLTVMTPSIFAAGGNDSVDILNMQGEVMKSVIIHNNMELFAYPWYMCISNTGHILVADLEKDTVTCLTLEGQTEWIYSGTGRGKLRAPTGITTTHGGDILVVDSSLKKVIQLSESGEYIRDVLTSQDGLRDPEGVCVDEHGTLYICESEKVLEFMFIRK